MKKTLTAAVAAALLACAAAGYALAQKDSAQKGSAQKSPGATYSDGKSHADCPLMRGASETKQGGHDAHGAALDERGGRAMGFSQTATAHHFLLKEDGGVIQVEVKDARDAANRESVRRHLAQIARAFAAGDFDTPAAVHARVPPGVDTMRRLRSEITYAYEETEGGGLVRISTKNAEALAAVRDFLRFQIEDHRTGDPVN